MKNNKLFIKMAAVCLMACIFLSACGGSSSVNIDADKLAKSLVDDISYTEELSELSREDIGNYISVEDDVECIMYMGSGSTAEEVAVFTAKDETKATSMEKNVNDFLNDQKSSFEDYIPEEAERIDNAVVVKKGNYVILCVSGDSDKAKEIINKAFDK